MLFLVACVGKTILCRDDVGLLVTYLRSIVTACSSILYRFRDIKRQTIFEVNFEKAIVGKVLSYSSQIMACL